MNRTRQYAIWPRPLCLEQLIASVYAEFATPRKLHPSTRELTTFSAKLNWYEDISSTDPEEFRRAIKKVEPVIDFSFHFGFDQKGTGVRLALQIENGWFGIRVRASSADDDLAVAAHEFVKSHLQLDNPPCHSREEGRPIVQATLFLGRHFDANGKAASTKLKRFFELLRFHVVEADEYRAGPIPDKVKDLIEAQDIYVGLVTSDREHDWITAESAFALGRRKHIILAVEDRLHFNPAVHGRDQEVIPFSPGMVEQTFLKFLEEIKSLGIVGI